MYHRTRWMPNKIGKLLVYRSKVEGDVLSGEAVSKDSKLQPVANLQSLLHLFAPYKPLNSQTYLLILRLRLKPK
jgi:hypothetical protein